MAELPDVVTLTTISSDWGNKVASRTVQRYSSVSNRTTEHPTPAEGDLSYLEDSNTVHVYDGAAWVPLTPTTITDFEVDGYTETASYTVTTSMANASTVSLTIPAAWGSWKCSVSATWATAVVADASYSVRITVDGTALQTVAALSLNGSLNPGAVVGRRTGMTTTGARTIALQASRGAALVDLRDIALYARAVRLT